MFFRQSLIRSPSLYTNARLISHLSQAESSIMSQSKAIFSSNGSNIQLVKRSTEQRGHADHDWLKTFHTFSFAGYHDPRFSKFGSLRVINEDRVAPNEGFGTHGHREFEIFSYIVDGELEHRDSMGNIEVLKRGDLQLTSAGTGVQHSEKTYGTKPVHFLQIWSIPSKSNLPPKYFTRHFSDEEKTNRLVPIVVPIKAKDVSADREGSGPAPVQSPLWLFASLISPGMKVEHQLKKTESLLGQRKAYIHVVQTSGYNTGKARGNEVVVNGSLKLAEGDGAFAVGLEGETIEIENTGDAVAEVLVFDLD